MESVLTTIKKMIGIAEDYEHFDVDITIHINTVLMNLSQIGVGPEKPSYITSKEDTWYTTLGDISDLEAVKTYMYLRVRLLFDPPTNSSLLKALKEQADELEWRLNVQAE